MINHELAAPVGRRVAGYSPAGRFTSNLTPHHLPQLATGDDRRSEGRFQTRVAHALSSPSPSCSSTRSSISHDSYTEVASLASTMASSPEAHPPSPLTPAPVRDSAEDAASMRRFSLKREFDHDWSDTEAESKKPRLSSLPGVSQLQLPSFRESFISNEPDRSPPFATFPKPGEDPITNSLNYLRTCSNRYRDEPKKDLLSRPVGLGEAYENINPATEQHTVVCAPQPRYDQYYLQVAQYPPSSPPMGEFKSGRAKPSKPDQPHCNVKYRPDQRDFIRYHKTDMKKPWNDIKELYSRQFPSADLERQVQGIQGVHYRENTHLPSLSSDHRTLNFLDNGHVKPINVPCRSQKDKTKYGLLWLFPERAMHYDWLPEEERKIAREQHEIRQPQKEMARRQAIKNGTWIEKPENGMCACCFKDEGDKAFRETKGHRIKSREEHESSPRGIQGYPYRGTHPFHARRPPVHDIHFEGPSGF